MQRIELIAMTRWCGAEGKVFPGQRILVDEQRARQLLSEQRACMSETVAPVPEDCVAKKSSVAPTAGQETSTPSSNAPGPATPSFASAAVPVSARRIAKSFGGAVKKFRGSEQSQ